MNDENEAILKAIEIKIRESHDTYAHTVEGLSARLQEVEQKSVGGYSTDFDVSRGASDRIFTKMMQSDSIKSVIDGNAPRGKATIDSGLLVKNTILGESGDPAEPDGVLTQPQRLTGAVAGAYRALNILDFIPSEPTSSSAVEYPRESSWTNDAAETSEGVQKPESDLAFELIQDNVRTIAHWLKTSKQAWEDSPWLQSYLMDRMSHGIRKRLQTQIISANGTTPNLPGITSSGRHTAFTPQSGETALDALNRSKYEIEGADYVADFVIINPATWGAIERQRRGSSDDAFTLGEGAAAAYVSIGMPASVWGLPVIKTNDLAAGKFIMGSRDAMRLIRRQEATVEVFEEDSDNVQKNLLTVRAELRAALCVMLPAAVRYGDLTA